MCIWVCRDSRKALDSGDNVGDVSSFGAGAAVVWTDFAGASVGAGSVTGSVACSVTGSVATGGTVSVITPSVFDGDFFMLFSS